MKIGGGGGLYGVLNDNKYDLEGVFFKIFYEK